jgi:hypothetical protein
MFTTDNGGEFLNRALHRHLTGRAVKQLRVSPLRASRTGGVDERSKNGVSSPTISSRLSSSCNIELNLSALKKSIEA